MLGNTKLLKKKLSRIVKSRQLSQSIVVFIYGLTVLCFFLVQHYSVDSYNFEQQPEEYPPAAAALGRPLSGLLVAFQGYFGFNPVEHQLFTTILSIFTLAISSVVIYRYIQLGVQNSLKIYEPSTSNLLRLIGSILFVFNIFIPAYFVFPENTLQPSIALLLTILSAVYLGKNLIASALLAICSVMFYQSWIVVLPVLVLIKTLSFRSKEFILSIFLTALSLVTSLFSARIFGAMVNDNRLEQRAELSLQTIQDNFSYLPTQISDTFIDYYNLAPRYSIAALVILISITAVFSAKKRVSTLYFMTAVIFMMLILPNIPLLASSSPLSQPRIQVAAASVLGAVCLIASKFIPRNMKFISILAVISLIIGSISILRTGSQLLAANQRDARDVSQLASIINQYQSTNDTKVKILVLASDNRPTYCRVERPCFRGVTNSVLIAASPEQTLAAFNKLGNLELEEVDTTSLNTDVNWREFYPKEQLYFDNQKVIFVRY